MIGYPLKIFHESSLIYYPRIKDLVGSTGLAADIINSPSLAVIVRF